MADPTGPRLGIVGVGNMGAAMWHNLAGRGQRAVVIDQSEVQLDQLRAVGATVATNLAELARLTDVVILSLPTSAEVEAVVLGTDGLAAQGTTSAVIDTTSGDPSWTRSIARRSAEHGIAMLDVGVTGGVPGARAGKLRLMAGGDPATFEQLKPTLEMLGADVAHCGDSGTGHAMKTLLNLYNFTTMLIAAEVMGVGQKAGLTLGTITTMLGIPQLLGEVIAEPGSHNVGFSLGLARKDCEVALRLAVETGTEVTVGEATRAIFATQTEKLGVDEDYFRIIEALGSA
jgi:3-hydroxyisobutyrate dehydrogenase-like beta-hydroxyacid dehydrogenase